jgi:hypothetical protein
MMPCPRGPRGSWIPRLGLLALLLTSGLQRALALPQGGQAEPPAEAAPAALEIRIQNAVQRGVDFLLDQQCFDGSFEGLAPQYTGGTTGIVTLALLKCGVAPEHPSLQRALAYMQARPPRETYTAALWLMVYRAAGGPDQRKRMEPLLDRLLDWKNQEGWGYPGEWRDGQWMENPARDFSNVHFAAFGIKAAEEAGLALPKQFWPELAQIVLGYLGPEELIEGADKQKRYVRGIVYRRDEKTPRSSITCAGAALLQLSLQAGLPARLERSAQAGIESVRGWLDIHFRYGENVGSGNFPYYNLMALERAAGLNGWSEVAGLPWYESGATWLLDKQGQSGAWEGPDKAASLGNELSDTAMALLFLKRASRPSTGEGAVAGPTDRLSLESPDEPISLRLLQRNPLLCTLVDFGRVHREAAEAGPAGGLRIVRVEWYLDERLAATLPGDPSQPWLGERFAAPIELTRRGLHRVHCRAELIEPDAPAGASGPTRWIESRRVDVFVRGVLESWMLAATLPGSNDILARERREGLRLSFEASSRNGGDRPEHLVDGLPNTLWLAERADDAPRVVILFDRPVRADAVVLTSAHFKHSLAEEYDRPLRLELRLDRAQTPLVFDAPPEGSLETWRLALPKPQRFDRLELTIVERRPGRGAPGLVGFSGLSLELGR